MPQRLNDWRGSTTRFLEAEDYVPEVTSLKMLQKQFAPVCEKRLENGLKECLYLSSARLLWETYIPTLARKRGGKSASDGLVSKTGVNRGLAVGVVLTAGCRECKQRLKRSTNLFPEQLDALLSRSLVLSPPAAIFISWRLEIGNTYQAGS